jgi:hypothetical protein
MGLDIDGLRLTYEERTEAFVAKQGAVSEVADAQLAKALWGTYHWLETWDPEPSELKDALEQANIERPTAEAPMT